MVKCEDEPRFIRTLRHDFHRCANIFEYLTHTEAVLVDKEGYLMALNLFDTNFLIPALSFFR